MSPESKPGDILMVRTNHFVSRLIRFGQRGYGKPASEFNHCGVCIGNFEIVEALTGGVVRSPISKYPTSDVRVLSPLKSSLRPTAYDELLRANAASFAQRRVGDRYGWATILCIALKVLFKGRWNFSVSGTEICSGLAAQALERLGYDWYPNEPGELTPAYLDIALS
jgi:uncharacterized protein YycO